MTAKTLTADQWGEVVANTDDKQALLDISLLILDQRDRLQALMNEAKRRAHQTGVYADRTWFLRTEDEIRSLSRQQMRLQRKLGILRERDRSMRIAKYDADVKAKELFARKFLRIAAELLDRDTYRLLLHETDRAIRAGERLPETTLDAEVDAMVSALGMRLPKSFDDTYRAPGAAHHFRRVPGNVGDGER